MRYLVTGGAGFIGSHLVEYLTTSGHIVLCIDDLSSGYISNIPESSNIQFINKKIQGIFTRDEIGKLDGIFHLAAQASVPKSIDDFLNSSANNLCGTLKVFDLARNLSIPVVYATSSAVYGNLPIGDDTKEEFDILSPYAQDKLTMEHYARMASNVFNTRSIGLRFFNVYGPRQDPSNPYSGVISIFIDRLAKKIPIQVNGGYQTRDFIYVTDIVNALSKSMIKLHDENICEVLNVGTGISISIDQLLQTLIEIIEVEPEIIRVKLPQGDPEISRGLYNKLESLLGLEKSQFFSLKEGLIKTYKYIIKNGGT